MYAITGYFAVTNAIHTHIHFKCPFCDCSIRTIMEVMHSIPYIPYHSFCHQSHPHPLETDEHIQHRAGRYDGIIVIPRYVNSPILNGSIIRFYRDRYYGDITIAEMSQKIMWR